jgi:hypothetical protein
MHYFTLYKLFLNNLVTLGGNLTLGFLFLNKKPPELGGLCIDFIGVLIQ